MLDKYKALFKIKSEINNLEAAESESVTVLKFKTKKAEILET